MGGQRNRLPRFATCLTPEMEKVSRPRGGRRQGRSLRPPHTLQHLLPSADIAGVCRVRGQASVKFGRQFLRWLGLPAIVDKLIPKTKDEFELVVHRPTADSLQCRGRVHDSFPFIAKPEPQPPT